jgi:hypothetical protein
MKTLVVPMVAMGCVPQYAVQTAIDKNRDLYDKTDIDSMYIYPFTSGDLTLKEVISGKKLYNKNINNNNKNDMNNKMCNPWELYMNKDKDNGNGKDILDFMQFHAPVIPGCESLFVKQLMKVIHGKGYTHIIILDAKDKGLWHGERNEDASELLHWANKGVGRINLGEENILSHKREEQYISSEETGPVVQLLDELCEMDIDIDYYAVCVYEGWNGPAVKQLLDVVGIDVEIDDDDDDIGVEISGEDQPVEGVYV